MTEKLLIVAFVAQIFVIKPLTALCDGDPNAFKIEGCGSGCGRKTCTNYKQKTKNIMCPAVCRTGCDCKPNYVYNSHIQKCVLLDDCKKCTKPHEVYDPCPDYCLPQTCESIGKEKPSPRNVNPRYCKGACRCENGYYRNRNGECISKEDCLKCAGPHEYFSCGVECDNVCETLSKQNQTNYPFINKTCKEMCYCEKGYARNRNKICVPIEECDCL